MEVMMYNVNIVYDIENEIKLKIQLVLTKLVLTRIVFMRRIQNLKIQLI